MKQIAYYSPVKLINFVLEWTGKMSPSDYMYIAQRTSRVTHNMDAIHISAASAVSILEQEEQGCAPRNVANISYNGPKQPVWHYKIGSGLTHVIITQNRQNTDTVAISVISYTRARTPSPKGYIRIDMTERPTVTWKFFGDEREHTWGRLQDFSLFMLRRGLDLHTPDIVRSYTNDTVWF